MIMKVGSDYKVKNLRYTYRCLCVDGEVGWFSYVNSEGVKYRVTFFDRDGLTEIVPEEWVAMMWKDNLKLNVELGGYVFPSEEACNKEWSWNTLYNKAVRIR